MRIRTVEATDIFSFEYFYWEFKDGIFDVQGMNGAGKSTIFYILAQGFFNQTPKGTKVEDANNVVTGKPYEITIIAENELGQEVKVVNSRKKGGITIHKAGKNISLKTIPQNLKIIEGELGCNYDAFVSRCYQSSSSTLDLVEDSKESARRDFVEKALRFHELDALWGKLDTKRKQLSGKTGKIELLKKSLETLTTGLGKIEITVEELPTEELENTVKAIEDEITRLTAEKAVIESNLKQVQSSLSLAAEAEQARARIEEIESELKGLASGLTSEEAKVNQELTSTRTLIARIETDTKGIQRKINEISLAAARGVCYACNQGVSSGKFDEDLAALDTDLSRLTDSLKIERIREGELAEQLRLHQRINSLSKEKLKLEAQPSAQLDVQDLKGKEWGAKVALDGTLDLIRIYSSELASAKTELKSINDHNQRQRTLRELNQRITENNAKILAKIQEQSTELEATEDLHDNLKLYLELISGFKTVKMQRFLTQLNKAMQKYTLMLCGGSISCRFYVDPEGKIQFKVVDTYKTLPWANWSDGQKARVKLATLFGTIDQLEAQGAESFNVLFLDEIFGSLDSDGREGLSKVLVYLKQQGKSIYTIAHTPIIHPVLYDGVIRVELREGLSQILP